MSVMDCPAGEEEEGSAGCTACQSGFYKSQSGTGNCTRCPINTEGKRSTGSTECSKFAHVLNLQENSWEKTLSVV